MVLGFEALRITYIETLDKVIGRKGELFDKHRELMLCFAEQIKTGKTTRLNVETGSAIASGVLDKSQAAVALLSHIVQK